MIPLMLGWFALVLIIAFGVNVQGNMVYAIPISLFVFQLGMTMGNE